MANEDRTATTNSSEPGPELLTERSLLGIFVHLVGFTTGIIGPGVIYFLSKDNFTRENARNALNWQLFLIPVFLVMATGILVAVEVSNRIEIPDALELV